MEEVNLTEEEVKHFMIFFYWFIMIPLGCFILQINNWYPFRNTWQDRDLYQWFVYLLVIPIGLFHIIGFIGGMFTIGMFMHTLVLIVTSIF